MLQSTGVAKPGRLSDGTTFLPLRSGASQGECRAAFLGHTNFTWEAVFEVLCFLPQTNFSSKREGGQKSRTGRFAEQEHSAEPWGSTGEKWRRAPGNCLRPSSASPTLSATSSCLQRPSWVSFCRVPFLLKVDVVLSDLGDLLY